LQRYSHATDAIGMLEFCGLIRTLIIDEDGIYDPRQPNDRLLGCGSSFLIGRKN